MIRWAITFLLIALVAGLFGFTGVAGAATEMAKITFFLFIVLLAVSLIMHAVRGEGHRP